MRRFRSPSLVLSALLLSGAASFAQTGFSAKTYPAVLPASSENTQLLSADFNNDGRLDLLAYGTYYGYQGTATPPGNVFLNDGHGGFLAPQPLPGVLPMEFAQAGDVNGDGYADIVGCANTGSDQKGFDVFVYTNKGNGTFSYYPYSFVNGQCHGLALGDVYRSGHLDIVVASTLHNANGTITNTLEVLKNDGHGSFTPQGAQNPVLDDAAKSGNFTDCGLIDVVGSDFQQNGQFSLLLTTQCQTSGGPQNAGTTYFATPNPSATNASVYSFTKVASAYDLYLNGVVYYPGRGSSPNVAYTGSQTNGYGDVTYARNDGAPAFTFITPYQGVVVGQAVGNLNTDNFPDIAVSEQNVSSANGPPEITILAGTSNETFVKSQTFNAGPAGFTSGGIVANDFNGDGLIDLATLIHDPNSHATSLVVFTNTQTSGGSSCSAPTATNSNVICSPARGANTQSPVTVNAASNVSGFTLNRLYLDNQSVYQTASQTISTSITAANGNHTLVLVSYDNAGKAFTTSTTFTVGSSGSGGCLPSTSGVNICAPAAGSTASSPVTITAGAIAPSGNISAIRAYIDNVAVFTTNNPSAAKSQQVSQSVNVAAGSHRLVVVAYQSTGGALSSTENFTVGGTAPCYPSGAGAQICSPAQNATASSPVTIVAGATAGSGYITAVRVYVDSVAKALINNSARSKSFAINTPVAIAAGKHNIVVVGYQSTGGSVSASDNITVQ